MARSFPDKPDRPEDAPGERDVEYWLGIYKTVDDVPDRYRLQNYESEFRGVDTWGQYLETRDDLAESTKKNSWYPCGDRFKKFMQEEAGRHHALPHPDDVESYLMHIKDGGYSIKVTERSVNTVYYQHLSPLKTFFNWLVHHVDYPHIYNPVLLAAHAGGITREVWYWQTDYKPDYGDRKHE
ncbi:hypothetical protein G3I44_10960 [Halogeometricum borinquense]|uniref:Site-specific integrase n=1 Tax=Halogeometricum borinquense TaxID=60847 RepID=A0A6C0UU58_9EURY|nr:hypothetical protein [Halogeometricum borinquense]QIB76468.1 hypothetical protein G3I44_10960 [Halogeometricum borinquense]